MKTKIFLNILVIAFIFSGCKYDSANFGDKTTLVANAGVDRTIVEGESITLDGSLSSDINGTIVKYIWSEGTTTYCNGVEITCTIPNLTLGTHNIELMIINSDGKNSSDNINVTVNDESMNREVNENRREVLLSNNYSAYIPTSYDLGMSIKSITGDGTVFSIEDDFVGAVYREDFSNATSSLDVLDLLKDNAFSDAISIISTNNADGSIKVQYELNSANIQAYAQLRTILEASGVTDFSNYIDYSSFNTIQNLYIDLFINYVDASNVYIIVMVTDKSQDNYNELNNIVSAGTLGSTNVKKTMTDTFVYSADTRKVDILFVMDDSRSMKEEQDAASQAIIDTFDRAMSSEGIDWKATVIGTEKDISYISNINNYTENDIGELSYQLMLGYNEQGNEVGLLKAYNYLKHGNIKIRDNSKLLIVYISDEVCHTRLSELGISNIRDSYFVKNNIKVNVIIPETGEYAMNRSNRDNDLAYQMANATGGEVANLRNYATGYDAMMQKIATNAAGGSSFISLSKKPIVASIIVTVNGVRELTGWRYNTSNNSIVFDATSRPNSGDNVVVSYNY